MAIRRFRSATTYAHARTHTHTHTFIHIQIHIHIHMLAQTSFHKAKHANGSGKSGFLTKGLC
eukprot:592580-Amphidinium_carterae.1